MTRSSWRGDPASFTLLAAGAAVLGACASTTRSGTSAPPDFCLSIVLQHTPADGDMQPAWYVLEPDGLLRAGIGERSATTALPVTVRTLRGDQIEALWSLAAPLHVLSADHPGTIAPDAYIAPDDAGATAVIYEAANGQRRTLRLDDPSANGDLVALARRLRKLAWLEGR